MDKFLNKRYKSERHENLDAILVEMGEIVMHLEVCEWSQQILFNRRQLNDEENIEIPLDSLSTGAKRWKLLLAEHKNSTFLDLHEVHFRRRNRNHDSRRAKSQKHFHYRGQQVAGNSERREDDDGSSGVFRWRACRDNELRRCIM